MTDAATVHLSPRQLEVARLIARGYDTGEIAEELGISPEGVKTHIDKIAERVANPNGLKPLRAVRRWAAQQDWLRAG